MKSKATARFWKLYQQLPPAVQNLAVKNYRLWLDNPAHPSLAFKKLQGGQNLVSVRIGDHYRAVGLAESAGIVWVWIGTHEQFNHLLGH
jgi:hypothetical protein